jgi:Endoplasmic Reticulum-Golgi Intermediate Compartment (ERGIC)
LHAFHVSHTLQLRIQFNVTMLDLPCEYAAVDVLDVLGTNRVNVTKAIDKWSLSADGLAGAYQGRNK